MVMRKTKTNVVRVCLCLVYAVMAIYLLQRQRSNIAIKSKED